MGKHDEFFGRDMPVQKLKEKPVFVFKGRTLEVERYCDLGDGAYWFVAEELPVYGREVKHGKDH
jgi:hypothetical protein